MKKRSYLYFSFLLIIIASCNDNVETAGTESTTTVKEQPTNNEQSTRIHADANDVDVDTLGMAEFLAMKAAEAGRRRATGYKRSNDISDVNDVDVDTVGFAEFKRTRGEAARRAYDDSISRAEIIANRRESLKHAQRNETSTGAGSSRNRRTVKSGNSSDDSVTADETGVASETPAPAKEKKGWSKKAKGAVIGAATGAAAGAIINKKNRGVGGVVGGVLGAATGYGIGRERDKKDNKQESRKDSTERHD